MLLLEQELERGLDDGERSAAAGLCAALEGHPVRILQAAALVRDHGTSVDAWARNITPATLIGELLASLDEKQRRALFALTALPGVPLRRSTCRASRNAGHRAGVEDAGPARPRRRQ